MVKRIDVCGACGINEQLAEKAESIAFAKCGINPSFSYEVSFVLEEHNWLPELYFEEWHKVPSQERERLKAELFRVRHYLTGRIACDIVDRADTTARSQLMPSLVKLANDLEARENMSTGLLGFFTRYSRRKEEERQNATKRLLDESGIVHGC